MIRYVTVPFQLIELELFEQFSFIWTGKVDQFISSKLEWLTSSFYLNWKGWPVHFIWTGKIDQFSSFQLEILTSLFHLSPGKNELESVFWGYCCLNRIFFENQWHILKAREILYHPVYEYFYLYSSLKQKVECNEEDFIIPFPNWKFSLRHLT